MGTRKFTLAGPSTIPAAETMETLHVYGNTKMLVLLEKPKNIAAISAKRFTPKPAELFVRLLALSSCLLVCLTFGWLAELCPGRSRSLSIRPVLPCLLCCNKLLLLSCPLGCLTLGWLAELYPRRSKSLFLRPVLPCLLFRETTGTMTEHQSRSSLLVRDSARLLVLPLGYHLRSVRETCLHSEQENRSRFAVNSSESRRPFLASGRAARFFWPGKLSSVKCKTHTTRAAKLTAIF